MNINTVSDALYTTVGKVNVRFTDMRRNINGYSYPTFEVENFRDASESEYNLGTYMFNTNDYTDMVPTDGKYTREEILNAMFEFFSANGGDIVISAYIK